MRKTILLILFIVTCCSGLAKTRTEAQMQAIAVQRIAKINADGTRAADQNLSIAKVKSMSSLNIYSSNRGFVVVSKDDAAKAVLGYSATPFNADNLPCGFSWWLEAMNESLATNINTFDRPLFANGETDETMFINTKWSQGKPYNLQCPLVDGSRAQTGCVATAMAQIIKYYEYPAMGMGKGQYYIGESSVPEVVNVNCVYDYVNMKDRYLLSYTEVQSTAVATIMADAGAAASMIYGKDGSAAYLSSSAMGFARNFQYDSLAIQDVCRDYYTDEEWTDLVYAEMAANHPILYSGATKNNAGHAFVFCGMKTETDGSRMVYINWGWGGSSDGYFSIDELKSNNGIYSEYQEMIYGLKPEPTNVESKPTSHFILYGDNEFGVKDSTLIFNCTGGLYNYDFRNFTGNITVEIAGISDNSTENVSISVIGIEGATDVAYRYGWRFNKDEEICNLKELNLKVGTYNVYFASQAEGESTPQPVRSQGGVKFGTLTVGADGRFSIDAPTTGISVPLTNKLKATDNKVYNINGQRVNSSHKGLVIINGKKQVRR